MKRFLLLLHLDRERATAFALRPHSESAILRVVPVCWTIVDLGFYFLLFRVTAMVGSLAVDLCLTTDSDSHRVSTVDSSAVRFSPALGLICPANFCFALIGFAIAPGSAVVAAAGSGLCRNYSAIEIVAPDPDFVRRRFVADSCLFYSAVAAAALAFVSDAASIARSFF